MSNTLVPSQTISRSVVTSTATSSTNQTNDTSNIEGKQPTTSNKSRRNRRRRGNDTLNAEASNIGVTRNAVKGSQNSSKCSLGENENRNQTEGSIPSLTENQQEQTKLRKTRKYNSRKVAPSGTVSAARTDEQLDNDRASGEIDTTHVESKKKNTRNQNRKRNAKTNKNRKVYRWWIRYIPDEAVDPITLEPLSSLNYPPFALVASEPYEPIPEWPIPVVQVDNLLASQVEETLEERQRRILEEQWGTYAMRPPMMGLIEDDQRDSNEYKDNNHATSNMSLDNHQEQRPKPHVNLFDGQALAYYMVSQQQFIDPFNRRDLTRDEVVNLDRYLRRHGFGSKLNVAEAYDTKGVTISTAGAIGNTAAGRAAILQQEARNLLHSLFRGSSVQLTTKSQQGRRVQNQQQQQPQVNEDVDGGVRTNLIMEQYRAHERAVQHRCAQQQQRQSDINGDVSTVNNEDDAGIYGDEGFAVIDEDINPGFRSGNLSISQVVHNSSNTTDGRTATNSGSNTGSDATGSMNEFPSLEATAPRLKATSAISDNEQITKKKTLPKNKTLAKIGNVVKKTDPDELQRQWEARELALKKAMLSNLTFGSNPVAFNMALQIGSRVSSSFDNDMAAKPTDQQIERNRILADALSIKPSGLRQNSYASGWARPTTRDALVASEDEFGSELTTTIYTDDLIRKARDYLHALLKLESKWITFLQDDKSASLPLNKMEKPLRAIVHEYASYWRVHTESFDPEPRRYIHCVKLRDTRAPYPLLSETVRSWKGPSPVIVNTGTASSLKQPPGLEMQVEHSTFQTAGQSTRGREILSSERKPLSLLPRSTDVLELTQGMEGFSISGASKRTMTGPPVDPSESRFGILAAGRERPKLTLQPRTLPLEVPNPTATPFFNISEDLARARGRNKKKILNAREQEEKKRRALEAVFASDSESDETDGEGNGKNRNRRNHVNSDHDGDDSLWEEQVAEYQGHDEE